MKRLILVLALLAAGCSVPAEPSTPQRTAPRPEPVGVVVSPPVPDSEAKTCPEAPKSLNPNQLRRGADGLPTGGAIDAIRDRGYVMIGVSQTLHLLSYRDLRTGEMHGLEMDIAKEVAKGIFGPLSKDQLAQKIRYVAVPTDSRFYALDTKPNRALGDEAKRNVEKVDMIIADATMTCQREETYGLIYSSPYLVAKLGILVRGTVTPTQSTLAAFAGKRVCAAANTTSIARIIDSKATPVAVPDSTDCMVMLQRGQVDAIATDDIILAGFAQQDTNTTLLTDSAAGDDPAGVAVSNEKPELVRLVNAVLDQMRPKALPDLYSAYFGQKLPKTVPPAVYKD